MKWTAMLVIAIGGVAVVIGWRGTHGGIWTALTGQTIKPSGTPPYDPSKFLGYDITGAVTGPGGTVTTPTGGISGAVAGPGGTKTTDNAAKYGPVAIADAKIANIDPTFFFKQINAESSFDPNAVSPAGAIGIAQFMPKTAAGLGLDPHDPVASLMAAASLMKNYIMNNYSGGNVNQEWDKALTIYNGGQGELNMAESLASISGDSWMNHLSTETRNYIHTITGD